MKGTYWYAVDYAGTGHLFTYKPERDTGIWNGEEALQVSQGTLQEVFPKITWQDSPVVVTLEVLPLYPEKISPFPPERKKQMI